MSFLKNIFGGSGAAPPVGAPAECSHQLPSSMVAKEFGEVNVKCDGGNWEILFTIMKEPDGQEAEGWQTGVALDASGSMQAAFGRGLEDGPAGSPPKSLLEHYHSQGWLEVESH